MLQKSCVKTSGEKLHFQRKETKITESILEDTAKERTYLKNGHSGRSAALSSTQVCIRYGEIGMLTACQSVSCEWWVN